METPDELHYFVDRQEIYAEVQGQLQRADNPDVIVAVGDPGFGKTTLLRKLSEDLAEQGVYHSCCISISDLFLMYKPNMGDPSSTAALHDNFQDYRTLLVRVAESLPAEFFADFETQADSITRKYLAMLLDRHTGPNVTVHSGDVNIGMLTKLTEGVSIKTGDVDVKIDPVTDEEQRWVLTEVRRALTQEFVTRLNRLGTNHRSILLVDDFQLILTRIIAEWLMTDLVPIVDNVAFVIARTESDQELPGNPDRLIRKPLSNFSLDDIGAYLEKRLAPAPVPEGLATAIGRLSLGHPLTVGTATDLALEYGLNKPGLFTMFDDLPADLADKLGTLIDRLKEEIEDEDVRQALDIGAVVRRFDAELLRYLMDPKNLGDPGRPLDLDRCREITEQMKTYTFVQTGSNDYKYHELIQRLMNRRMAEKDPALHQKLHHLVADYYKGLLTDYEQQQRDSTPYERWYRYESSAWQTMITEWLYHLSNFQDQIEARLSFTRVYFDAFWWWGCYREFPFCDQLITEWRRRAEDDQTWGTILQEFQKAYPTGYNKRGQGNWLQVEIKLSYISKELLLDKAIEPADEDRRNLKAIVDIFLAEAHRYQDVNDEDAITCYTQAYELFKGASPESDYWNMAWVLYELADLYSERGKCDQGLQTAQESLQMVKERDPDDYELIANTYRVQADIYWQQNDLEHAFYILSLAVLSAYAFQAIPAPPDFYTLDLYHEMVDRTLGRLQWLRDQARSPEAIHYATSQHDFWSPVYNLVGIQSDATGIEAVINENRLSDLKVLIFPADPPADQMGISDSHFVQSITYIVQQIGDRLKVGR